MPDGEIFHPMRGQANADVYAAVEIRIQVMSITAAAIIRRPYSHDMRAH